MRNPSIILLCVGALLACSEKAHAAKSYDNCTGTVASLPAVISTPGTWCLKQNLATSITSGDAITIATDDVTLDCNDFRIDGLGAGTGTATLGVHALNHSRARVRHCNIRGFYRGLYLEGTGTNNLVEDNHFNANAYNGLRVEGDRSTIRHNEVVDTGGTSTSAQAYAIVGLGSMDIRDNTISGVIARSGGNGYVVGIVSSDNIHGSISGNRVQGLIPDGTGKQDAIENSTSSSMILRNNDVEGDGIHQGFGIDCVDSTKPGGRAKDNVISGFPISSAFTCGDAGGNDVTL